MQTAACEGILQGLAGRENVFLTAERVAGPLGAGCPAQDKYGDWRGCAGGVHGATASTEHASLETMLHIQGLDKLGWLRFQIGIGTFKRVSGL
eukprot:4239258-Alexandrium_andersonii.AAC.1